tara:strand:+ start:310 stop:687 length:378 start_codon:yes stop_codon:yes gene_type:complete
MKKTTRIYNTKKILKLILKSLGDDKAFDVKSIDLLQRSSIADFMIIASGTSSKQVSSMANNLRQRLKDYGIKTRKPEGLINSDWVLIDAFDIVIHLFRPEVREFYRLEKMWEIPNLQNSKNTFTS